MTDMIIIVLVAVLACAVIGAAGLAGLRVTRRASLRYQMIIAGLTPVLAVAVTAVILVQMMFLSSHDTRVILVALGVSLLLAAGLALLVTRRIVAGTTLLGSGISGLSADRLQDPPAETGQLPAELAALHTELEQTQQRLAESRTAEQAAQRARQELVRHLSHDLRTPLAGLRALAEALEDGMVDNVPRAMQQIRGSVGRMDSLVADLFELSRIQGEPQPREHALLSLTELITDVADEAEPAALTREVRMRVRVPEHDRLSISGDGDALARAIGNLIANAVHHTDPGGAVAVTAGRTTDGGVAVAVSDGCGGIPDLELPRVFEAGWRGDVARSGADGAGLGLAIARGVVESHAGRIGVRNDGPGCRFDVELPPPSASN